MRTIALISLVVVYLLTLPAPSARADGVDYKADLKFALDALEEKCARLIESKDIDWGKVRKAFLKNVKSVKTPSDHLKLMVRLLARLEDGHAAVHSLEKGKDVQWPDAPTGPMVGPGMFWCRVGKKIIVKNCWSASTDAGISAGAEILKVDGKPVAKWIKTKIEELRDTRSFSTEQQAFYNLCHWGLAAPSGTRMELEIKTPKGKKKRKTVTYRKASVIPSGPAIFPEGLQGDRDIRYGKLPGGNGYIHLRRCPGDLPQRIDKALAALGDVPGLILDFRANGGGGFDHDAFLGRFVPQGETLSFAKTYKSAGPNPYSGPIVVIVDAGCRSAGETGSGIFKEDGRAYMIGETPTAGMSSSKTSIDLPSGLFSLYVSVASNKGRFNKGKGIEGIGVPPHEIVEYDPRDLAEGKDTLILRAEELLKNYPKGKVPYEK